MELTPPLVFGLGILLLVAVALLITRINNQKRDSEIERAIIELSGRLSQMAESHATQQSKVTEQLQTQERILSKNFEERMADFSKRLGDHLQDSSTRSQQALSDLRERLAVIDKAQQNITDLSTQVVGLQDILANKQARGAFGEVQLQAIVESVLPPSAYGFQVKLSNEKVADCLLQLPNPPGPIAIDSKFPLESYEALQSADSEESAKLARRAFQRDLKKHIADIAAKYLIPGETADGAILFLPSESVYAELHANFRSVVDDSFRAKVWIVSPTTLWATLTTILAVLRDVKMREQAAIIQREVDLLLTDIHRLGDRVEKLSRHFDQTKNDIDQIKISAGKVAYRGEKIVSLELDDNDDADEQSLIEKSVSPRVH